MAKIFAHERIFFPTFEVASNPTIKLSDIKARRFNIIDTALIGVTDTTYNYWYYDFMDETANAVAKENNGLADV